MTQLSSLETGFADLIFINGKIITVDRQFSIAQAVAVKSGKIAAIGANSDVKAFAGKSTRVIDLHGKTMLPGINDSHIHASLLGVTIPPVVLDLSSAGSKDEIVRAVAEKIRTTECGGWIRGAGLDTSYLASDPNPKPLPTRWDLDRVSPDNPVFLSVAPFHSQRIILMNTRALDLTGIHKNTLVAQGGEIVKDPITGEPTGLLRGISAEAMVNGIVPAFTREQKRQAIEAAMKKLHSYGITSITEPSLGPGGTGLFGGLWDNECIHIYNDIYNSGDLTLRVSFLLLFTSYGAFLSKETYAGLATVGMHTGFGNEWLRLGGIKLYADGIPPMKTAWMNEDYPAGGNSKLVFPGDSDAERCQALREVVSQAHNLGFQIGVHATGDKAISACIDSFINAEKANSKGLRHYIIHGDFISKEDSQRMAEYSIGLSVQPALASAFAGFMGYAVGQERAQRHLPLKTLLDNGVHVAGGSDAPVINPDWRMGVQAAVLREAANTNQPFGIDQRISLPQAIRMYTLEGAYQDHMQHLKGSIEIGKLADFCILEEDILNLDPHRIKDVRVLMTVAGGKIVYDTLGK